MVLEVGSYSSRQVGKGSIQRHEQVCQAIFSTWCIFVEFRQE